MQWKHQGVNSRDFSHFPIQNHPPLLFKANSNINYNTIIHESQDVIYFKKHHYFMYQERKSNRRPLHKGRTPTSYSLSDRLKENSLEEPACMFHHRASMLGKETQISLRIWATSWYSHRPEEYLWYRNWFKVASENSDWQKQMPVLSGRIQLQLRPKDYMIPLIIWHSHFRDVKMWE